MLICVNTQSMENGFEKVANGKLMGPGIENSFEKVGRAWKK